MRLLVGLDVIKPSPIFFARMLQTRSPQELP